MSHDELAIAIAGMKKDIDWLKWGMKLVLSSLVIEIVAIIIK